MRILGSPRDWPPPAEEELALLISRRATRLTNEETRDADPNLEIALKELDAWLSDPRPYEEGHHGSAWRSMAVDVRHAITACGHRVRRTTPSLAQLEQTLVTSGFGADQSARARCAELTCAIREELGRPQTVVGAFDDLYSAVRNPGNSGIVVDARLRTLEAALACTGRSLRSEGRLLAGVLDNAPIDVASARHSLTSATMPEDLDLHGSAGLPVSDRLRICRELLRRERPPGHHVLWTGYGNAHMRGEWRVDVGPVTFFDGPTLLGWIDAVTSGQATNADDLPQEILTDPELSDVDRRQRSWPHDLEDWVAVRIDLGERRYADPVRTAWEQADALVQLAGLHAGGTSWRRFSGYKHVVDSQVYSESLPFGPAWDHSLLTDHTGEQLARLAPRLAGKLPVTDALLADLLRVSALVHDRENSDDPTSLLQDVQAIELVASRCSVKWNELVDSHFLNGALRQEAVMAAFNAVWTIAGSSEFEQVDGLPQPNELQRYLRDDPGRQELRIDVAVQALERLATTMPAHHAAGRRIRSIATHCLDARHIAIWADELATDFKRRLRRLKRCRDALIHGGPINMDVAATVQYFANRQAQRVVGAALEAVLEDRDVAEFLDEVREHDRSWRSAMKGKSAVDALLGRLR
jgi:hypothetical protein